MSKKDDYESAIEKYATVESLPEALPESIDPDEYVIATWYVGFPPGFDMNNVTQLLAIEQSTGTWVPVPGETSEVRRKHVAKVIGLYEGPYPEVSFPKDLEKRNCIVYVAFPVDNFGSQIPLMLTTVYGNLAFLEEFKLLDLRLPEKFTRDFPGPQFGIEGIREELGVDDRPLLNNMIKPCTGFPPEVGAELAGEAAAGGCDAVKDDELLGDRDFNRIEDRVPLYMEAIDEADSEKGEKTIYFTNVTDNAQEALEKADKVKDAGGNGLMINFFPAGFPTLQALAEDDSVNLPILAHPDVVGGISISPTTGMTSHLVLGKLPRLAGADVMVYPAPYGKANVLKERYLKTGRAMWFPFNDIRPMLPMPSGGISPKMVPDLMGDFGKDFMIGQGGATHAHPMGPRAGARAFRQAIDAVIEGVELGEKAEEHEELKLALERL